MTARATQQIILVGYSTSPTIRISSVALEVVRVNSSVAVTATGAQVVVVAS